MNMKTKNHNPKSEGLKNNLLLEDTPTEQDDSIRTHLNNLNAPKGVLSDGEVIRLYESIASVENIPTRKILYIQFIHKYFPEAYEALIGHNELILPKEEQGAKA